VENPDFDMAEFGFWFIAKRQGIFQNLSPAGTL
jgi:hypothetical protein